MADEDITSPLQSMAACMDVKLKVFFNTDPAMNVQAEII